jgi:hypothetical protein
MKISDWLLAIGVLLYLLCIVSVTTILLGLSSFFIIWGFVAKLMGI